VSDRRVRLLKEIGDGRRAYVQVLSQLLPDSQRVLRAELVLLLDRGWSRDHPPMRKPTLAEIAYRVDWERTIFRMEVELRPGRQAIIRDPDSEHLWRAELHFEPGRSEGLLHEGEHDLELRSIAFVSERGPLETGTGLDITTFWTAFKLDELRRNWVLAEVFEGPPALPARGKPPNPHFYRTLLAHHDQLVATEVRNPAAFLASEYGKPEATVRTWIRRGRKHLGRT